MKRMLVVPLIDILCKQKKKLQPISVIVYFVFINRCDAWNIKAIRIIVKFDEEKEEKKRTVKR